MKLLIAAIATMIASPALAQTAPAPAHAEHTAEDALSGQAHADHSGTSASDPHAGHDMSGGKMDCCQKGADGKMDCCDHSADGTMACCSKMKAEGEDMPCCDKSKADGEDTKVSAEADPHAGHDMSSQW